MEPGDEHGHDDHALSTAEHAATSTSPSSPERKARIDERLARAAVARQVRQNTEYGRPEGRQVPAHAESGEAALRNANAEHHIGDERPDISAAAQRAQERESIVDG